jgi:hypothetical protein
MQDYFCNRKRAGQRLVCKMQSKRNSMQQASDKLSVLEAYSNPASSILNLMINALPKWKLA